MSVVAIFKKNKKNRHKRYIACDDVVEEGGFYLRCFAPLD